MFGFWKKKQEKPRQESAATDILQISDELQHGANTAFEIGAKWLEEQDALLFLFMVHDGKPSVAPIKDCQTQEEALAKVRKWACDENTKATWFVQMSTGSLEGANDINALIAHCADRTQKHAFVLFQKLKRNPNGRLCPNGEIDFMTRIPNDFFIA